MNTASKLISALLIAERMPTVRRALLKTARKYLAERARADRRGTIRRVANQAGQYL